MITTRNLYKQYFKRLIDICFATILTPLVLILFIPIAVSIKLDSKGPIIFKTKKIGKNLFPFHMYKFRTMVQDADKLFGGYSTEFGDNRITKVGAFLRKFSLDELPQFFNILKGDMSLIGPRPDVIDQAEIYSEAELAKRHQVLPGITGLAQSINRHNLSISQRKKYDIFYNTHICFSLDIKILINTLNSLKKKSF